MEYVPCSPYTRLIGFPTPRFCQLIETSQMRARGLIVAGKLIGPRQPELRRQVLRVQRKTPLEPANSLVVSSSLGVELTEEIESIGIRWIDARDMFKGIDCRIRLGKVAIEDAKVVPGACAVGLPLRRVQKNFTCFVKTLNVEQSNAFVQSSCKQRRIVAPRLPEKFKGLCRASPTHLGDTEVVGSNGVDVARARGRRTRSPVRASDEAAEDTEKQQNASIAGGGVAGEKTVRSSVVGDGL